LKTSNSHVCGVHCPYGPKDERCHHWTTDDPTPEEFADPVNWHPIEEHPYLNDPPKVTMTDNWTVKQCSRCGKRPEKGDVFTSVTPLLQGTWHHNDCDDPTLEGRRWGIPSFDNGRLEP
jgi:hypothetical protein